MARIELLDALMVKATNLYSKLGLPEVPTLFVEFHGSEASVKEQSERFGEIAARVRRRRRSPGQPGPRSAPGCGRRGTTATSPPSLSGREPRTSRPTSACRSRGLPIASARRWRTSTRSGLVAPILGHVGDGNFHLSIMVDMEDPGEVERAAEFVGRLNLRAIEMDGTCTGEHGIGQGKMKYLERRAWARARLHARDQAGDRPEEHHESREDRRPGLKRLGRG